MWDFVTYHNSNSLTFNFSSNNKQSHDQLVRQPSALSSVLYIIMTLNYMIKKKKKNRNIISLICTDVHHILIICEEEDKILPTYADSLHILNIIILSP